MKRALSILLLLSAALLARQATPEDEEEHLHRALSEAGTSPVEFIRAIEDHLERFPESPRRPDLERALVKAAIEAKDDRRILTFGERVLEREKDDLEILDRVTRILIARGDAESAKRALEYARRYSEVVQSVRNDEPESPRGKARWRDQVDRGLGEALLMQARAEANLGRRDEAVALARRSYDTYPSAEAASEIGSQLISLGKEREALAYFADAFHLSSANGDGIERARIRQRLGEIYRKLNGAETGLGDLLLEAYDRTAARMEQRRLSLQALDPNSGISNPMDYTMSALSGEPLPLASLRGKVVVFDFWATWCGPCRVQHPLYEEVKARFRGNPGVVFLSVNTDADRVAVAPFLKENGWDTRVYFEDGLSGALRVSSIPTTIVVNKQGEITGRLVGFIPDRFVDMLAQRIGEALRQ